MSLSNRLSTILSAGLGLALLGAACASQDDGEAAGPRGLVAAPAGCTFTQCDLEYGDCWSRRDAGPSCDCSQCNGYSPELMVECMRVCHDACNSKPSAPSGETVDCHERLNDCRTTAANARCADASVMRAPCDGLGGFQPLCGDGLSAYVYLDEYKRRHPEDEEGNILNSAEGERCIDCAQQWEADCVMFGPCRFDYKEWRQCLSIRGEDDESCESDARYLASCVESESAKPESACYARARLCWPEPAQCESITGGF
jgi:hypothetical protein